MTRQLPADCLNEIFERLEEDKINLRSCLLVNRLWCEIAVRILWKNVWNFQYSVYYRPYRAHVPLAVISTLVACLPNESKDLLCKNGIFITPPTWKPTLFNYASFCKVISIHKIDQMVQHILENQQSITSRSLNYNKYLVSNELLKMFMNQISSLKSLNYDSCDVENTTMFICLPEARNCLAELTELDCSSDIHSEFFYQISQICHNIQSLTINFEDVISNGLADLISLQNNLKSVTLQNYFEQNEIRTITSSLIKFSSTLTKLKILESYMLSLSFIAMFANLQELIISLESISDEFNQLQNVSFPQLKVLKLLLDFPNTEIFIKFLEINGKNLNELYIKDSNVNLSIVKFCPNLKILFSTFMDNDMETLKAILSNCQYLESIKVYCAGNKYISEKELFEIIAKYSPKKFHELKVHYIGSAMNPENLESFFTSWKDRIHQKPLILTVNYGLENEENMEIIERYMKLGVVKKVEIKIFYSEK